MIRSLELSIPPKSGLVLSEYKYLCYALEEAKHKRDELNASGQDQSFISTLKSFISDCADLVCTSPCRHNSNMNGIKNDNPQTHPQVLLEKYKNIIKYSSVNFETNETSKSIDKFNEKDYQDNLNKLSDLYVKKDLCDKNNVVNNEINRQIRELELIIDKQLEMKSKMIKKKTVPPKKPAPSTTKKPAA